MITDRVPVRTALADLTPYGAPQLRVPVRLNTNETPYPPPAAFFERLTQRLAGLELHRYPDRRAWQLRGALGERFGRPPEQVWAANGSNEVLLHLLQAYGGPARRLLVFRPGYSMYPPLAAITGTELIEVDLDPDFHLTAQLAAGAVADHEPDLVFVASPNNPTGIPVDPEAIQALHDGGHALLVVDEAYAELAAGNPSAVEQLDTLPRLVVARTFSKGWRLAGLRLGYLLCPSWVVDDLCRVRLPYHLDALTQTAGLVALELADEVTAHLADVVEERGRLHARLAALDQVTVWPSAANFLLFRTEVEGLFDRLLAHGILVRDFSDQPGLEGCLRVTVGTSAENDAFVDALKECL